MVLASATLAATHLAATAPAQQTFASRSQVIKAGIVLLESSRSGAGDLVNWTPHVWFNLDSNKTVKPAGWTFVNPHATAMLSTEAERSRWERVEDSLVPTPPNAYRIPGVNQIPLRLSKRTAPYWEVPIGKMTDAQVADYDVLLVSPAFGAQLNPAEREKLRRFVDKGGVLWIDPSALPLGTIDTGNSFPTPFGINQAGTGVEFKDFSQPLINGPQPLSLRDLSTLSAVPDTAYFRDIVPPVGPAGKTLLFGESFSDFFRIKPVVGVSNNQFSMGVSRIGDGFVVMTSRAVAMKLNRVRVDENPQNFGYTTNLAFSARDANLQTDGLAAAKFAVNMISLAREYSQPAGGSQRSGGSPVDVNAPLIKRQEDRQIAGIETSPVMYKGFLVATAGNIVRVYDADPGRDFDGDGNPDDGLPDPGVEGRDLIWESSELGSNLSSPVCVEIPNTDIVRGDNSPVTDQVLVVDGEGRLHALDLIAYLANGRVSDITRGDLPGYPISAPGTGTYNGEADELTHSPTVHENMAYMVDRINSNGGGRIWMVDLVSGTRPTGANGQPWFLGGGGGAGIPAVSHAATIGFIPILDNSGGMDRVLYAPLANIPASGGNPGQAAGFTSVWLGAKGEKPADYEPQGTDVAGGLTVQTRASREGIPIYLPTNPSPYGVHLSLLRADGSIYSTAQMGNLFSGVIQQPSPGTLLFPFNAAGQLPPDVAGIRIDYSIDFGGGGPELANAKRGDVQLPDATGNNRRIVDNLALTPRGTLYMTTSNGARSGTGSRSAIYGFREEGRGSFKCVMRYELYPEHSMGGQGLIDQRIPSLFEDVDPVQNFAPAFLAQPFTGFNFRSAPVVRGDVVYAVAEGTKGLGIPTGVIMAFKAEPETTAIYLDNFPANGSIVQPDLARSNVTRRPEVSPAFQVGQVPGMTYDAELKLLRIENLATATKGQLQAVLNLSQPIIVRTPGGGTPDRLIYPNGNNAANRFDPLLWFSVLNGYRPGHSCLTVTGNTLFLGGSTPIRSIMNGQPLTFEGQLYALDTDIDPTSDWLASSNNRPWMKQLLQLRVTGGGFQGNPAQKWPLVGNIADGSDFLTRLNQAVVPAVEVKSVVAGEGILAAVGTTGLFSYSRSDFLVADQGRIGAFDPGGSPTFELTSSGSAGDTETGNSGSGRPVVQPSRAYPLPNNEILVADPGANRVFRVNRGGTETRSIAKIKIDPRVAPANYPANGSLTLNAPRDVTTYTTIKAQADLAGVVTSGGAAYEYWTHYLIADSGNRRLVEIVDRYEYDPVNRRIGNVVVVDGAPQLGVLIWQSPAAVNGKGFDYNSVSRVLFNDRYVYFAGIGGAMPTATDTGSRAPGAGGLRETAGYGGVVVFDPTLPNGVTVVNTLQIPQFSANTFWNEGTSTFNSALRAETIRPLVNVTSVTARTVMVSLPGNANPVYQVAVMVTDANGVFEFPYVGPPAAGEYIPRVQWMLPNEVYRVIRRGPGGPLATNPRDLRAMYARRVESGEVLVVNGYFGQTRGVRNPDGTFSGREPFRGEVIQVDGSIRDSLWTGMNMGFGNLSLTFRLELITETRGLVLPVFADRR